MPPSQEKQVQKIIETRRMSFTFSAQERLELERLSVNKSAVVAVPPDYVNVLSNIFSQAIADMEAQLKDSGNGKTYLVTTTLNDFKQSGQIAIKRLG